jgi:predicted DNA-binding transcriptional regulator AlpA
MPIMAPERGCMKNSTEWLTVSGVADRIGLTRGTVRVMHSAGKLPSPDMVVGPENMQSTKLWRTETIDEWNRTRKDTP